MLKKTYNSIANAIASYSFTDVSSGTGIVKYYPLVGLDDSGATYHLVEDVADSYTVQTASINGTVTLTFDSPRFNLSREVKGIGYLSAHVYEGANAHITAQLWRWDGTTATAISTKTTSGIGINGQTKAYYLELPVTASVTIASGEQVRLIVEYVATGVGNNKIGHSPTNQTSPTADLSNTQMVIGVPFRVDI